MITFFKDLPLLDKILNSSYRIMLTLLAMCSVYSLNFILPTNSFYSDSASSEDNTFTAGYWIPELSYSISPAAPDGEDDWYVTRPCVTLSANIHGSTDDITIYYEFSNDGNPVAGGTVYGGTCVSIPDGEWNFQAQAVNDENPSDWKSNSISFPVKVDTGNPGVAPVSGSWTRQTKNIKMRWPASEDAVSGIAGYRFEISGPGDGSAYREPFASCGLIETNYVPNSGKCFDSDDMQLTKDGEYKRRVKAIDKAGNESDWSEPHSLYLDTAAPVTKAVSAELGTDDPQIIKVTYDAGDNAGGAGIKSVSLYYRLDNGSGFGDWKLYDSESEGDYFSFNAAATGAGNYEFYTVGEDKADDLDGSYMTKGNGDDGKGNVEVKKPESAEVSIKIETPVEVATGSPVQGGSPAPETDVTDTTAGISSGENAVIPAANKTSVENKDKNVNEKTKGQAADTIDKIANEDQTAPTSRVKKIKERTGKKNARKFKFTLSARDAGSGVAETVVYYRKGDEDWKKLGETDTDIFKTGKLDRGEYEFYTLAEDKAGNQEQKDNPKPEARITITKDKVTVKILTGDEKAKKAKHKSKKKAKKGKIDKSAADKKKSPSNNKKRKKK